MCCYLANNSDVNLKKKKKKVFVISDEIYLEDCCMVTAHTVYHKDAPVWHSSSGSRGEGVSSSYNFT